MEEHTLVCVVHTHRDLLRRVDQRGEKRGAGRLRGRECSGLGKEATGPGKDGSGAGTKGR